MVSGASPIPLLAKVEGSEVVFGAIGKFWRPASPRPTAGPMPPGQFHDFAEPDWAKAAMSISVTPVPGGGTLLATSRRARRLFLCYWPFVSMGSRLIRVDILRAIARWAERAKA